jgi:hypothetical protein
MSGPFQIQLIGLKRDLSAFVAAHEKIDLGSHPVDGVIRLADRLLLLAKGGSPGDAGLLVQRGDQKHRITVHEGRLRVYKSSSLFDEFWTAANRDEFAALPPFRTGPAAATVEEPRTVRVIRYTGEGHPVRKAFGLVGMGLLAIALMFIAIHFGTPRRRLNDLPAGITLVNSAAEREAIFRTVAGSFSTGTTAGNSIVVITLAGEVTLASIGKDGQPMPPRVREIARAGRRGDTPVVITSFGVIAAKEPPKSINVGAYAWKSAATAAPRS